MTGLESLMSSDKFAGLVEEIERDKAEREKKREEASKPRYATTRIGVELVLPSGDVLKYYSPCRGGEHNIQWQYVSTQFNKFAHWTKENEVEKILVNRKLNPNIKKLIDNIHKHGGSAEDYSENVCDFCEEEWSSVGSRLSIYTADENVTRQFVTDESDERIIEMKVLRS